MGKSTARVTRKRQRARELGLCSQCCRGIPSFGRSICKPCNLAAIERVYRKRKRDRETTALRGIIEAHERAGDVAREHYLYKDAAQHYQYAVNSPVIADSNRMGIAVKLGSMLFLTDSPDAAAPWLELVLSHYIENPEKAVEALLEIARQKWIDSKTEESLPIIAQAIRFAEATGNPYLRRITNLKMINHLHLLERYSDVEPFLQAVGNIDHRDEASLRATYYMERGFAAMAYGNAFEVHEQFERAVDAAKEGTDVYRVTAVWINYARVALALGSTATAKTCAERALFIARRGNIAWRIPHLCLAYADILARIGEHDVAYKYLLEALAYDVHVPVVEERIAGVGIPLALYMKDEATLAKCIHPHAIHLAFQSGEPARIARIATSFARLYAEQGDIRSAQALLHRALVMVRRGDYCWDLQLEISRHGNPADIAPARLLLEARVALPHANVARACLSLFDAFIARRNKQFVMLQSNVLEAVEGFEALQWHAYADMARSLLEIGYRTTAALSRSSQVTRYGTLFADVDHLLTPRERQVAEFVLKGFTNREIAEMLAIKERTVEAHMTAIMKHLGVRSRYELTYRMRTPQ